LWKSASGDPVIFLGAEDLTSEADSLSTAHSGQSLDRLLKSDCVLSAKADASPFEHLGLLGKVRDIEGSILRKQCLVSITDQVIDFVK